MAIDSDVVVIGGGVAGVVSAVAVARNGADVRLLSHKKSTLRQASGLIDALGYVPPRTDPDEITPHVSQERLDIEQVTANRGAYTGPFADPYAGLDELPDTHPYSVVGEDALREGLALFDDLAGDRYRGSHTDSNALVPTFGGGVKPTARYPRATAAGLVSDDRPMLVVGFRQRAGYDGRLVAERLESADVPFGVTGVEVDFPAAFRPDAKVTRFAESLDRNEAPDGTPVRRGLADAVEPHLDGADRVGFPAMLGTEEPERVRAELGDLLGVDVFEIPTGPPSLLGLRLERRLYAELEAAGVKYETGNPVVDYETAGDGRDGRDGAVVRSVVVDRKGQRIPYSADAFVLATGGLVGKGIDSDRERVREPIFDCRVPHPEDRYEWFVDDAFGDQPYARFGVEIDGDCRPLDADGDPEFANLFAAGAVVGGADVAREKSASGVSLATGFVAGQEAAAEAQR